MIRRIMRIDLISKFHIVRQRYETVRKAFRYKELPAVFGRKLDRDPFEVSRRAFPDIDRHVKHRAAYAPYELGLGIRPGLEMQPSDRPFICAEA